MIYCYLFDFQCITKALAKVLAKFLSQGLSYSWFLPE